MEEKPSLDMVKAAIRSAVSQDAASGDTRKAATEFLEQLKKSVHAWEICDQLLSINESVETSFLAAHMLRGKITRNFNELPIECYSSLKDSMLNHLQTIGDYSVQGQLTSAVAELTLLLQNWKSPIEDLAKTLSLEKDLMELIRLGFDETLKGLDRRSVFAQIIHQMSDANYNPDGVSRLGGKRREEFENYLTSRCSQVIQWWLTTLSEISKLKPAIQEYSANIKHTEQEEANIIKASKIEEGIDKLIGQIYLCYSAWSRVFDAECLHQSLPLIDAAFLHLRDLETPETVHRFAVEVVVATAGTCEEFEHVDHIVDHLLNQIYSLSSVYQQSVANEDLEKSSHFAKAFSSVAETACSKYVIQNKDFRAVELVLSCLNHYDFEIVEETYPFWWRFLDLIQSKLKPSEYLPYIPYVNRLIIMVTKLCEFDPDENTVVSQSEDIHRFRAYTSELITNVMFLTNVRDFMRDMDILNFLKQDLSKFQWEKIESVLYLIYCISQNMSKDDTDLMKDIFECILTQQTRIQSIQEILQNKQVTLRIGSTSDHVHPQIVATSLRVIGSVEAFLADNPDYLALAINYILTSINQPHHRNQLITYAATSLCNIIEMTAKRHFSSCPELLVIVKNLCTSLAEFDAQASDELLRCSSFMADAIEDDNIKDQFLCEILKPITKSILDTFVVNPELENSELIKYFDWMSIIFKNINLKPATLHVLKGFVGLVDAELWPILVNSLELSARGKGILIEKACRLLRYIIRCLKPEWMIERIAETMISVYKTHPQNSSPLYICSILVDEFANKSPEINQGLFNMLEIFCTMTFHLLDLNSPSSKSLLTMKNYPETVDDMMRLFNRFLKKCPGDFMKSKGLGSMIELSISSLRIDHPDANSNVCRFMCALITISHDPQYKVLSDAIRNVLGIRITDAVIKACLLDIPASLIGEEAEVLMKLYSFDKNLFITWVQASLSTLPKTNIQAIECVSPDQIKELEESIVNASSLKKMVNCLRSFARLYT